MLVTRETDYAVRTVLYLARDRSRRASVTEIAEAMRIPKCFLAKLLQRLVRHHILSSSRGVSGGFQLAQKPADVNLLSIVEAVQGPAGINVCAIDSKRCEMSKTCTVHPVWVDVRKEVEKRLKRETIAKLISREKLTAKKSDPLS
jgi:Rrf2 family protein